MSPGICSTTPSWASEASIRAAVDFGRSALSATSVTRMTEVWQDEYEQWNQRDLTGKRREDPVVIGEVRERGVLDQVGNAHLPKQSAVPRQPGDDVA